MRCTPDMQERGPESHDSVLGDGVPLNGAEPQAARRAHMREQTTARQAAERRLETPRIPPGSPGRRAGMAERVAEVHEELERIEAEHQTWLRDRGEGG